MPAGGYQGRARGAGGISMARLAVGETLRLRVTEVSPIEGHGKFRTVLKDEEGLESALVLDVELPLGMAELRIMHLGEREGFRPPHP